MYFVENAVKTVGFKSTSTTTFSKTKQVLTTVWIRLLSNDAGSVPSTPSPLGGRTISSGKPPAEAKVVICGGGIVGSSIAYHLAKHNWTDVVIVEQGRLAGGSTWSSSGILGQLRESAAETRLCKYSLALFRDMEARGLRIGWKRCGSLNLARTDDRMIALKRLKSFSVCEQIECSFVTPFEVQKMCPIVQVDDIKGALWVPDDGVVDPYLACNALLREAMREGIRVYEGCKVKRILVQNRHVVAVETDKGTITCDYFVNCAGLWARHVGQMSDPPVLVPLHPCEHHYLLTKPISDLDPNMPAIRDYDGYIYFREKEGRLLAGGFEPVAKPAYKNKSYFDTQENKLQEDWDHFHVLLEQILHRSPQLQHIAPEYLLNGPQCFTPDGGWILGKAPKIYNYFVASGTKTMAAVAAGGIGNLIAHWMVNQEPLFDVCELDIQRFIGLHNNRKFLQDRVKEVPGWHYKINYPFSEFEIGRKLRMSPIYPRLKAAGAIFSQTMGYERPAWFEPLSPGSDSTRLHPFRISKTGTFGKPPWFDRVHAEYRSCREGVALLDYSSFTKLELRSKGREVVHFLQYVCSNDADIPVGSITHTGMHNIGGGYENDCSLARLDDNHYMMIAPTIQQARCQAWLKRHAPSDGSIKVIDVTSMYTAICLMGTFSRTLLAELTDTDVSSAAFPFFTFKELDVGLASRIRVMNLTHTGEVGWILYIPNEFALHVYERIMSAGAKYDIQHAGAFAMRTLRIEKFYAFWGQDLDTTTTPLECGRGFRVNYDKGDFIGRDALVKQRETGVKRRYVQLILENHDLDLHPWPWRQEPIYRDGQYVGITTTTCYGYTLEKQVCLGFVQNFDSDHKPQVFTSDFVTRGNFEVEIAGQRFPVKVNLHSPQIPSGDSESSSQDRYMATRTAFECKNVRRQYGRRI